MTLCGYSWVLEGQVAAMAMLEPCVEDMEELKRRGIGAVVNLTLTRYPQHLLKQSGLAYAHIPVKDFAPPRPQQIDRFVEFCDEHIGQGRAVVVHCFAGRGRTGTMAACYLVHRGMPSDEAIESIRRIRPGSIETLGQEEAVRAFARRRTGPVE